MKLSASYKYTTISVLGDMMRKSLTVTVFVLFFTIDCSLAEDLSSPSKGDVILMMERIEKILQVRT